VRHARGKLFEVCGATIVFITGRGMKAVRTRHHRHRRGMDGEARVILPSRLEVWGLGSIVKACPHQVTNCCRKRQQIVARNGNICRSTCQSRRFWQQFNCCRFRQQSCRLRQQFVAVFRNFVAWCGQALSSANGVRGRAPAKNKFGSF